MGYCVHKIFNYYLLKIKRNNVSIVYSKSWVQTSNQNQMY